MSPDDLAALLILMTGATVLLWLLPSCGDPACSAAHTSHSVRDRIASVERDHLTFHDPRTRPNPLCARCAEQRRDQDKTE